MFSTLNSRQLQRSFLLRLLQTTGLSLALLTASAAEVYAEDVTVQGAPGENGADAINPGDLGGEGGPGEDATASATSVYPFNRAIAIGGVGGDGGNAGLRGPFDQFESGPGDGGVGGAAKATAVTAIISGSEGADSVANGGNGGNHGAGGPFDTSFGNGGSGGDGAAIATSSSGNGNATASASATGGSGTQGEGFGGFGGDANASSRAMANGFGDALASADATGGAGADGIDGGGTGGSASATANASAAGGGKAIATAIATPGIGPDRFGQPSGVQATSSAETVNGAMAQALATAGPSAEPFGSSRAASIAKTSFAGVTATATAPGSSLEVTEATVTTDAIAQGGSAQTSVDPNAFTAISVAIPDKAFATMLIDGASNVAAALQGPQDEIFGAAILDFGDSIFDFSYRGDLLLGVIDGSVFDIAVNGAQIAIGDPGNDSVINLGSFGPSVDLTISGFGTFAIGGAVPEPSTWAMLLLGFAGLGFAGYRQTRGAKPQAT